MFLILLSSLIQLSFAQNQGELYFQPQANQSAVLVDAQLQRLRVKTATGQGMVDTTTLHAGYQYGFNETLALGVLAGYQRAKSKDSNSTASGMDDLEIHLRGLQPYEGTRLRYGLKLDLSLENSKYDADGNVNNSFSGANVLEPYVAFEIQTTPEGYAGVSVAKEFLLGKRTLEDSDGTKLKNKGGEITTLRLYYEHFTDMNVLGAYLEYVDRSNVKIDGGGTSEGIELWDLTLYSRWQVAENTYILPQIGYGSAISDTINDIKIDKWYAFHYYLGARFLF